ncbi:OprO/OprP family phosphate-selective porin [Maricaulis maris]|uniref:OprO/OprP family phosphate-selective porin n=1 Tax=Maricaulis maris TaxID=74318 RepID=UPI003B8C9FE8
MKNLTLISVSALACIASSQADAQDGGFSASPAPRWDSADGETSFKLRGRLYYDRADVDWTSPNSAAPTDRDEYRTARLGFEIEHGPVKFVAEYDFSGDDAKPNDVLFAIDLPEGGLRIGHFKTMNSLEEQTSSRYGTFMERGISTDLFGVDRRIGVAYNWAGDGFTASVGVFGGKMDDNFAFRESDESSAVAARVTWSTVIDETRWHVGGSWRRLDHDGGARVRVYPQAHLANRFTAADYRTGAALGTADSSDYFGLELAAIRGPFHLHSEVARMSLDGPTGDPSFTSGMVQAGWILSGETRPYKESGGTFNRLRPDNPVTEGGWGAVEVAVRHDISDLGDANLGRIRSTTLGANWYLHDNLRVMTNYVTARMNATGFTESSDTIQFRLQADF